jgi:hypothetical protein
MFRITYEPSRTFMARKTPLNLATLNLVGNIAEWIEATQRLQAH